MAHTGPPSPPRRPAGDVEAAVLFAGIETADDPQVAETAGRWLAGETVDVVCDGGLVHIHHEGVSIATHARSHQPDHCERGRRVKT
jgi:hypothetical protein